MFSIVTIGKNYQLKVLNLAQLKELPHKLA
jgi:hypothetical protein